MSITQSNLPNVKIPIDSFSISRGTMNITGDFSLENPEKYLPTGAFYQTNTLKEAVSSGYSSRKRVGFDASRSWSGSSNSTSVSTSTLGTGTPLNIIPPYYTVNIWLRLS